MSWSISTFAITCFTSETPTFPEGYGDASEFPESIEAAHVWVQKALKAERFNYFVIWQQNAGDWVILDEYKRSDPVRRSLLGSQTKPVFGSKAAAIERDKKAQKNTGRPYSKLELSELRSLVKAKTPLKKIAKALKRPEGGILQKAELKLRLRKE